MPCSKIPANLIDLLAPHFFDAREERGGIEAEELPTIRKRQAPTPIGLKD